MFATLFALVVSALLLKITVSLVGGAGREKNTFGRAFVTAAVLGGVAALLGVTNGGSLIALVYGIAWLFVVKSFYGVGWLRAFVVGIVQMLVLTGLKAALVAAGVMALGILLILPF